MLRGNVLKRTLQVSLGVFIMLGGCYDSCGAGDQKKAVDEIQNQILALRNEFKLQIEKAENDRLTIAERVQTKLADLIKSQQSLNTSYPEFQEKVNKLTSALDMYNDKIATLEQGLGTIESTMNEHLDTVAMRLAEIKKYGIKKSSGTSPGSNVSNSSQPEPPPLDVAPGQLFRAAYSFYRDGDYETAIAGFQKFLSDYPNHQLAGAAQYWIAEAFAKLGAYETAVQEYDVLIKKYPQNDKVADAYYGKGIALSKLGKTAEATTLFTYVQEHFPGTVAAKKAGEQMQAP